MPYPIEGTNIGGLNENGLELVETLALEDLSRLNQFKPRLNRLNGLNEDSELIETLKLKDFDGLNGLNVEGDKLVNQEGESFKPIFEGGKVIGIIYKMNNGRATTLGKAQVQSRYKMSLSRNLKNVGDWLNILNLFE